MQTDEKNPTPTSSEVARESSKKIWIAPKLISFRAGDAEDGAGGNADSGIRPS